MLPFKKRKILEHNIEDTIDVKHPYHIHLQDTKWVRDEIYGFLYQEADVEAHRRMMEGSLFRKTPYQAELRIVG